MGFEPRVDHFGGPLLFARQDGSHLALLGEPASTEPSQPLSHGDQLVSEVHGVHKATLEGLGGVDRVPCARREWPNKTSCGSSHGQL